MSAQMDERALERARSLPVMRAIDGYFRARAPRKDASGTTEAYMRDLHQVLAAIAHVLDVEPGEVMVDQLTLPTMREAFAAWADPRAKGTVRRAHTAWSGFLNYLVGEELLAGSFMVNVGKPKRVRREPKAFSQDAAALIVRALMAGSVQRREPWPELDAAAVLTLMTTGTRMAEVLAANIGDITRTPGSERLRVLGKGDAERSVPIEPALLVIVEAYLRTRRARFPERARQRGVREGASEWDHWRATDPLFVDRRTGERLRRGALQYLVLLVYRAAGVDAERARGALVHALRHTAATRMVEGGATAVELMDFLGHRSLATSQGYVKASGREIREAAARNPVYGLLAEVDPVD